MRILKLLAVFSLSSMFLLACGGVDPQEVVGIDNEPALEDVVYEDDAGVWAKDNFDLQAVGNVLEESDDIKDFEKRINTDDRFNNLDLNGDGYVDYVSVREFDDRDDNQRGFSLFSKFDGNDIQEIASIIFDRDRPDQRGARVYLDGNDQIYGNNYDYQGNWLDKSLDIARSVFGDRDEVYSSPYYNDNYPDYYNEYRVVETPVYRERITRYMVNPAMTKIDTPTMKIKIKSPYKGKSYDKIYAKLAKPNKNQVDYYRNRSNDPDLYKRRKADDKSRDKEDKRLDKLDKKDIKSLDKFDKRDKAFKKSSKVQIDDKGDRGKDKSLWEGKIDKKRNEVKNQKPDNKGKKNESKPQKSQKNKGDKGNGKNKDKGKN